jgi:putative N-acetylmannosamine-6-phosphate epimerase
MDLEKDVPGLCRKMCPASSREGKEGIRIKTEAVSDVKQEEDPVPIPLPGIKSECEVSCMSMCPLLGTFHTSRLLPIHKPPCALNEFQACRR